MPLGYCPHVTLPQENPLVWGPPYNKIKPSFEEIPKETL